MNAWSMRGNSMPEVWAGRDLDTSGKLQTSIHPTKQLKRRSTKENAEVEVA